MRRAAPILSFVPRVSAQARNLRAFRGFSFTLMGRTARVTQALSCTQSIFYDGNATEGTREPFQEPP